MKSATLKRALSMLLVLAFVLTAMPFALAEQKPKDPIEDTKIADKPVTIVAMSNIPLAGLFNLTPGQNPDPQTLKSTIYFTANRGKDTEERKKYEFTVTSLSFELPANYQLTLGGEPYKHFEADGKTVKFTAQEIKDKYLDNLYLQAMPGAANTEFSYTLKGTAEYTQLDDQNKEKTKPVTQEYTFKNKATTLPKIVLTIDETSIGQFDVDLTEDKKDEKGNIMSYSAQIQASLFTKALKIAFPDDTVKPKSNIKSVKMKGITGINFLPSSDGVVVNSAGNAIGPNTTVDMANDTDAVKYISPDYPTKDTYVVTYHAVALIKAGDVEGNVPFTGTIRLHVPFPNSGDVPEFSRTINSADKSVIFSIDDIATAALEIRKAEKVEEIKIVDATFSFDSADMTLNFANSESIESGKNYTVINSSTINVVSKKPTSDGRLFYVAHGSDGFTYNGSIVIKGVNNEKVNPATQDVNTNINGADGKATIILTAISKVCNNKNIVGIVFTFADDDVWLWLGSETNSNEIHSGDSLTVVNSSAIIARSRKVTSDVRIMYEATADDGSIYRGYIVLTGLKSGQVDPISGAYSIYVPGGSVLGEYAVSAITSKISETISEFRIESAVFTPSATGSQAVTIYEKSSWKESSTYGYLGRKEKSGSVTTFEANETLRYIPGTASGIVTITYKAIGKNTIYTGTMTFTVYSVKNGVSVTLNLKSRDPYLFSNADNDKTVFADFIQASIKDAFGDKAVCKYVAFDAVQKSSTTYGTLYADSNKTALSVRSASQPTATGYYFKEAIAGVAPAPIANLYYVPTTTAGSYTQNYSVFVTFDGKELELPGTLTIKTPSDSVINPDILYQVTTNTRVTFAAKDFDTYLKGLNKNYTFDYVRFTGMPASGNLYYGNTEITSTTLGTYDFYETAGASSATINNVSYVPAGTNYYVTIPFTVYYKQSGTSTPASRTGTIVICVTSGLVQDINYTTKSTDPVMMKGEDFASVCQAATGATLSHVYFTISSLTSADGRLSYSQQVSSINGSTAYYLATTRTPYIDNVKFTSAKTSGTVTFQYTAYSTGGTFLYSGKVNVKLYTETKTPAFSKCVLSAQKMICNGQAVSLQAYNIDGYNYLKLRDIAALLSGTGSKFSIQVTDSGTKREVYCTLGGNYTIVADDLQVGADQSKTCVASSWAFYVDGEYKSVYVYNIGGYNYFKLRDLGSALKFGVDYNSETNTAIITSSDYIA